MLFKLSHQTGIFLVLRTTARASTFLKTNILVATCCHIRAGFTKPHSRDREYHIHAVKFKPSSTHAGKFKQQQLCSCIHAVQHLRNCTHATAPWRRGPDRVKGRVETWERCNNLCYHVMQKTQHQSGEWGLKNPLAWPSFFKYFRQFKEKQRPSTFVTFALRIYNSYNHAHAPGSSPSLWPSPGPWPDSKCSKTVEVRCSWSELKPCQREIATDEYKSARVSALTGSVPCKMAKGRQKVSAPSGIRTRAARLRGSLQPTSTTKPAVRVSLQKKTISILLCFATCKRCFECRIVVLRLLRLNIQARHEIPEFLSILNANLWSIHLIAFDIDWNWNVFTSHMFSSLLIEQLTDLEKVRIQNLKFKTDLPDRVMDGWSLNHIHAIVNITFTLSNSNQAALTLGSSSSSNHTAASKQCSTYEIALMQQHLKDEVQKKLRDRPDRVKGRVEIWESCYAEDSARKRFGNALCLISPARPAQAVQERCPKSSAIDFAVKTFDCLLE